MNKKKKNIFLLYFLKMSEGKQEKLIPFEANHELHGALLGVAVAAVVKGLTGASTETSLGIGTATAVIATASMKTFGHPKIF